MKDTYRAGLAFESVNITVHVLEETVVQAAGCTSGKPLFHSKELKKKILGKAGDQT